MDDFDHERFLKNLIELKRESGLAVLAYCLMPNHFHLALRVDRIPLSAIIQRLLTRYVMSFNLRHDRTGHLFQARYKAVVCVDERYLLRLVDYIHTNPVRAGLVAGPGDWRWSSYGAYALNRGTALIQPRFFDKITGIEPGTDPKEEFDPWMEASPRPPVLLRSTSATRDPLDAIAESFCCKSGTPIASLRRRDRHGESAELRRRFILLCLREGHTLTATAHWLGCTPAAVHYQAYRRGNLKI